MQVDCDRLADLYTQLGGQQAEGVVNRAMEELAVRICKIEAAHRRRQYKDVAKMSRGLVAIADQVGLKSVARVAQDVCTCCAQSERVALAATVARLGRICDRSLCAVWDLQDMTV